MARIKLVPKEQATGEVKEVYKKIESNIGTILNIHKAVAQAPALASSFLKLGNGLLSKIELPPKYREFTILRIAKLTGSEYLKKIHIPIALEIGLSQKQIEDVAEWQKSSIFDARERAALQYIDEVSKNASVTDQTFNELPKFLSDRSIVELTIAIGYYSMIARVLVALKIETEAEPPPSPSQLLGKGGKTA